MITVTVPLTEVAAFCARYGVTTRRTGQERAGLPVCEWVAEEHQTPEQAEEWAKFLGAKRQETGSKKP